jgi:hypothetical protein
MTEVFTSLLDEENNYDFLFEENGLDINDREAESHLYKIDVFGKNYLIVIGVKRAHPKNKELFYRIAYVTFEEKVVFKLGIYESKEEEEEMDIENMKILIDPKYYMQPELLEQFAVSDETINKIISGEYGRADGEYKENTELPVKTKKQIILVDDTFDMEEVDLYKMIKIISNSGSELIDKNNSKKYQKYYVLLNSIYRKQIYEYILNDEIKNTYKNIIVKDIFKNHVVISTVGKKNVVNLLLHNRINENEKYVISIPLLTLFEYALNIKIILVKKDNTFDRFSLYHLTSNFEPSKIIIKNKSLYEEYKPTHFMFVKHVVNDNENGSISEEFIGLKYNDSYLIEFETIPGKIKKKIATLFYSSNSEYHVQTQQYFDSIFKDSMDESDITSLKTKVKFENNESMMVEETKPKIKTKPKTKPKTKKEEGSEPAEDTEEPKPKKKTKPKTKPKTKKEEGSEPAEDTEEQKPKIKTKPKTKPKTKKEEGSEPAEDTEEQKPKIKTKPKTKPKTKKEAGSEPAEDTEEQKPKMTLKEKLALRKKEKEEEKEKEEKDNDS